MSIEKTVTVGGKKVVVVAFDFSNQRFTRIDLAELHQKLVNEHVYQDVYTSIATDPASRTVKAMVYNSNDQSYTIPYVCTIAVR